jgi:rubrerythrin
MTRELGVFEVLEIAERMEREAARFYRKAAGLYRDPSMSKLFSQLAQWEKGHMQVFAEMRDRLAEPAWEQPRGDISHVAATRRDVPSAVFHEFSDPARELTGTEDRADVIRLALQKERYTIGYYTTLTEFALGSDNLRAIREILQEERRHVKLLTQSLQQATR